ncbi:MAG: DUF1376 domain-containing protein [Gammaproteobacteria bacterium]|nr:DUF1376 domain-containing protein [Gammaproteobacteria bacterium]
MAGPPYVKFYASEWDADTLDLSALEDGVYFRIMKYIWKTAKIPTEERLPRITGLTAEEWAQVRDRVACFFRISDGCWHHDRAEADIAEVFEVIAKKSKGGKASALARKAKREVAKKRVRTPDSTEVLTYVETDEQTSDVTGALTIREENIKEENRKSDNTTSLVAAPLSARWIPNKTTLKLLASDHNINAPFALGLVAEFKLYWLDRKEPRTADEWQETFVRWACKVRDENGGTNGL